jgi:phenylacetate-coenzyme A ligase PaaK-like adenylate-forming protein
MSSTAEHLHTFGRIWIHPHKNRGSIIDFQNRKLRSIITHAYHTVDYYRQLFDTVGIKPEDIRTIEDLYKIPITSSQEYRIRPEIETLSKKVKLDRMVCRATSGSSGRPFKIRRTVFEEHLMNFFRIRALQQFGVRFSDRTAQVRLVSRSHQRDTFPGNLRQGLGLYRTYSINSLQPVQNIIGELRVLRPDIIKGYPGVLSHVASSMTQALRKDIEPKLIVAGGESLVPFRRKQMESGFGKKVFDLYGAHESNMLAWECSQSGLYHICDDNVILEILRDGMPVAAGERGEVVVTCLHSYAMPFIRYSLGDIVTRGPKTCSCGQPFTTLRAIQGRMHDYFKLPDASLLHPDEIIVPIMENQSSWFDRYQLLQKREDLMVLMIQPFHPPTNNQLKHVEQLAAEKLPKDVEFRIEIVENLPLESTGKFRFCKSLVNSHLEGIDWDSL